jgi:hypothetical protein
MLQPTSANVLRVGTAIEVLWKLNNQNKTRLVWWPARIQEICFRGATGDVEGTATIQYECKFGFDQCTSAVNLIQGQVLSERNSHSGDLCFHKWRLEQETPGSSSLRQQDMNADAGKHSYLESSSRMGIEKFQEGPLQERGSLIGDNFEEILSRIRALENVVSSFKSDEAAEHACPSSRPYSSSRSLRFTTFRLGEALERVLPSPRGNIEKHSNCVRRENVKVEADCTLEEFRNIAKHFHEVVQNDVQFQPPFRSTQNPAMSSNAFLVRFKTYKSLCIALGVSPDAAISTVIKERVDRRNPGSCQLRVIGVIACSESSADANPMVVSIGHSIIEQSDDVGTIPTVFRASTKWDEVDKSYVDPLEARHILPSELYRIHKHGFLDCNGEVETFSDENHPYFRMRWIRKGKNSNPYVFQESTCDSVFGVLETSIPCAIFRGKAGCEEVSRVCKPEFIINALE